MTSGSADMREVWKRLAEAKIFYFPAFGHARRRGRLRGQTITLDEPAPIGTMSADIIYVEQPSAMQGCKL